jgi:hypothetical protein
VQIDPESWRTVGIRTYAMCLAPVTRRAKLDIERLDVLVRRLCGQAPGGLTARDLEVLRLLPSGKTNLRSRGSSACSR